VADSRQRPFLDRPAARLAALGVFALCAGALAYLHRDDLFGGTAPSDPKALALAACLAERGAEIDKMVNEGLVRESQAKIFRDRARGMCNDLAAHGKLPLVKPEQ
jgi:hypothetical protein